MPEMVWEHHFPPVTEAVDIECFLTRGRGRVSEGPLPDPVTLVHGQTTRNPIERRHVVGSYKGGMAFDRRKHGSKGEESNSFTHSQKHTNSRTLPLGEEGFFQVLN